MLGKKIAAVSGRTALYAVRGVTEISTATAEVVVRGVAALSGTAGLILAGGALIGFGGCKGANFVGDKIADGRVGARKGLMAKSAQLGAWGDGRPPEEGEAVAKAAAEEVVSRAKARRGRVEEFLGAFAPETWTPADPSPTTDPTPKAKAKAEAKAEAEDELSELVQEAANIAAASEPAPCPVCGRVVKVGTEMHASACISGYADARKRVKGLMMADPALDLPKACKAAISAAGITRKGGSREAAVAKLLAELGPAAQTPAEPDPAPSGLGSVLAPQPA